MSTFITMLFFIENVNGKTNSKEKLTLTSFHLFETIISKGSPLSSYEFNFDSNFIKVSCEIQSEEDKNRPSKLFCNHIYDD